MSHVDWCVKYDAVRGSHLQARAVGSDSGIRIAALTKELLEITNKQRERDEQCEQKIKEANTAVREANEWARGLQVRRGRFTAACVPFAVP